VDKKQIAAVIAEWTGVPLNRLSQNEMSVITDLPQWLGDTIKGQDLAIKHLHKHLLTARADLRRPGRPLGAFLLAGPSGVGKTETVLQLAELLYGGRQYLTTINMSEFQEKHTVTADWLPSRLCRLRRRRRADRSHSAETVFRCFAG
jgi:type VI secretion system protein VasG